jgi:hypothetical protein
MLCTQVLCVWHEGLRTAELRTNLVTFSPLAFTSLLKVPVAVTWSADRCTA